MCGSTGPALLVCRCCPFLWGCRKLALAQTAGTGKTDDQTIDRDSDERARDPVPHVDHGRQGAIFRRLYTQPERPNS